MVTVKEPKGEMSQYVNPAINVHIEDGHLVLAENENAMLDNPKQKHAFHGLYRSLVHNMVAVSYTHLDVYKRQVRDKALPWFARLVTSLS